MSKKDEAATEFIDSYDADYSNAGQNISESHKRAMREGFWNGWTQHGEELMKMAREKAFELKFNDEPVKVVFISDLEAIVGALK